MALTDFWEIKDNQSYLGKPLLNVYHVKRILAGATAGLVGQAFMEFVLKTELTSLQNSGVTRTTVEVANLGDATDFANIGSTGSPGTLTGAALPVFNAATIQFNRTRNDMKNGMKRYFVGGETEQANGTWLGSFVTSIEVLAAKMLLPWAVDASPTIDVCEFVILKRFCVVAGQSPCLKYRLPDTDAEIDNWNYVPVSSVTQPRIRSQVSRKILT